MKKKLLEILSFLIQWYVPFHKVQLTGTSDVMQCSQCNVPTTKLYQQGSVYCFGKTVVHDDK